MGEFAYCLQKGDCRQPDCDCPRVHMRNRSSHERGSNWWDRWHMQRAITEASASRDPSTKCGAVIVRPDKTHAGGGFNGFPRNMSDDPALYADRPTKLKRTIHAEMNACINTHHENLTGYTLYTWPYIPCSHCAIHMIQYGIRRVVAPSLATHPERWQESMQQSLAFFAEAGVVFTALNMEASGEGYYRGISHRRVIDAALAEMLPWPDESNPADWHI